MPLFYIPDWRFQKAFKDLHCFPRHLYLKYCVYPTMLTLLGRSDVNLRVIYFFLTVRQANAHLADQP